jgi:hypothetical protein
MGIKKYLIIILILLLPLALALDVNVGCPETVDLVAGNTFECIVGNPDLSGTKLMSLRVSSSGADFVSLESLVGTSGLGNLFSDEVDKSGFVDDGFTSENVFRITMRMTAAGTAALTLTEVVVKTSDDIIHRLADRDVTLLNTESEIVQTAAGCADTDWTSSDGECQASDTLTRTWTKTTTCSDGVDHPATESITCTYQDDPTCTPLEPTACTAGNTCDGNTAVLAPATCTTPCVAGVCGDNERPVKDQINDILVANGVVDETGMANEGSSWAPSWISQLANLFKSIFG